MKKLEHGMLLDAKKVEALGLMDYLMDAYKPGDPRDLSIILGHLIEDLASCDVSADYEKKESTWGSNDGSEATKENTIKLCIHCDFCDYNIYKDKFNCLNQLAIGVNPIDGLRYSLPCSEMRAQQRYRDGACFKPRDASKVRLGANTVIIRYAENDEGGKQ